MPRIINNLLSGKPPLTPSPADIEAKIGEAEANAEQARAEHAQAALEAEGGLPGSAERLAQAVAQRQAATDRLETLRSALSAAHIEDQRHRARMQAKLRKENLARLTAALERRDQVAVRLAEHIGAAVIAWRELVDWSDKAAIPVPGGVMPQGALLHVGELRRAVEREIYRQGARALDHGHDFPGGRAHDVALIDQPDQLPALVDECAAASRWAINTLAEQPLEPAA